MVLGGKRLLMAEVIQEHIEIVPGAGGPKALIAGHRIRVLDVVISHEKLEMSPDEIVDQNPIISLADATAALSSYWDHHDDVEDAIEREDALVQEIRNGYAGRTIEDIIAAVFNLERMDN